MTNATYLIVSGYSCRKREELNAYKYLQSLWRKINSSFTTSLLGVQFQLATFHFEVTVFTILHKLKNLARDRSEIIRGGGCSDICPHKNLN